MFILNYIFTTLHIISSFINLPTFCKLCCVTSLQCVSWNTKKVDHILRASIFIYSCTYICFTFGWISNIEFTDFRSKLNIRVINTIDMTKIVISKTKISYWPVNLILCECVDCLYTYDQLYTYIHKIQNCCVKFI